MAEKPQKKGKGVLKRLVKKRKGKVSKTGMILSENGRLQIFGKNGRFPTKMGGLESLAFLRGWHCACCPRLRQLELTYRRLLFSQLMMTMMIINGYLLNLEIVLVLEMFADTGQEVIQCRLQLAWGFPPRSKLTLRKVFHPAVVPQPLFRQNLLTLKLMWQFVLNRAWQMVRFMFMSGSIRREAAVLKDVITTGKRSQ